MIDIDYGNVGKLMLQSMLESKTKLKVLPPMADIEDEGKYPLYMRTVCLLNYMIMCYVYQENDHR